MKSIYCIVIFLLSLSTLIGQAPTFEWARQLGGTGPDFGRSIAADHLGNVYTTGYFSDTADFDPGPDVYNLVSAGDHDIFISKLDSDGNFVWAKSMGGIANDYGISITVDGNGNVYTTGWYNGTGDFDPGPDTFNLIHSGTNDVFISKLDTDGNFVWARQFDGLAVDRGHSIAVDEMGNVYTTGYFNDTVDFDPGPGIYNLIAGGTWPNTFISKLDTDGNFVWAKVLKGELRSHGNGIAIDELGYIYTTGGFSGIVDFDPGPDIFNLTSANSEDIFISKLDTDGNFVWVKQFVGTSTGQGFSINVDALGNVYTTGVFRETVDFDPGPDTFNLFSLGHTDIFISKLDTQGNFVWAKAMGGSEQDDGRGIVVDDFGNVYTTGRFDGVVDFDPGLGVFNLSSSGLGSAFISKLDTNGNFAWAGKLSGGSSSDGRSIDVDNFGNIYTTGIFSGTTNFDPGPGIFHLNSFGSLDIFVHKMKQCLSEATISSEGGDFEICKGDSLNLAVNEGVTYSWSTGDTLASIQIAPEVTTSYSVSLTDANECVYTDVVTVTVHDLPEAFIEGEPEVCQGSNLALTASGGEEYLWNTGESSASITVSPSVDTDYHVTVTDSFGCSNADSVSVAVLPLPEISISGETEVCPGDTILLTASGGLEYLWSAGETGEAIEISPTTSSDYSVTATGANGCTASVGVLVDVSTDYCPPCAEYAMPNVFTPGDDGVNDLFYVITEGEALVREFRIYSRWGNLVHHSTAPWDGTQNGHPLPSDVYIYMVTLETNCGVKQLRGEVSLLR